MPKVANSNLYDISKTVHVSNAHIEKFQNRYVVSKIIIVSINLYIETPTFVIYIPSRLPSRSILSLTFHQNNCGEFFSLVLNVLSCLINSDPMNFCLNVFVQIFNFIKNKFLSRIVRRLIFNAFSYILFVINHINFND